MSKVLTPSSPEEYDRVVEAAAAALVPVQPLGGHTLLVPDEWTPPKAPKAKAEPEPEPAPKPALKAEAKPSETTKSARSSSSKEVV